jgi:dihydroorotate dehydrogenase (fumarate)
MTDLRTTYLGLKLHTPLVASASPLTGSLDGLLRLERAGVAAAVLPSLFEEEVDGGADPLLYLRLVEQARAQLSIPVIASLNGVSTSGWVRLARQLAQAGAHAVELNVYLLATDPTLTALAVERRYLDLVAAVRAGVDVPLAVKIGPYFNALPSMAQGLVDAGADGLVLFNRFYQPDIDIETLAPVPRLALSTSDELRLPLQWIAFLSGQVHTSLALSTGVHTPSDVVKGLLAGADVTMTTSALLRHGPEHVALLEQGLRRIMAANGHTSVAALKGLASHHRNGAPEQLARVNYLQSLTSFPAPMPV